MKITLDVSEKNEGTSYPWWLIIDPEQNLSKDERAIYNIAGMITGPFFSRDSAQNFLNATRYNFSKHAVVYCHSGGYSDEWVKAVKEAKNEKST